MKVGHQISGRPGYGERAKKQKSRAEEHENTKIDVSADKRNIEVHTVGKIDREIYRCITEDIVTDEVR